MRKLLIPQLHSSTAPSHDQPTQQLQRSVSCENVHPHRPPPRTTDHRARLSSDSDVIYDDSSAVGMRRAHSCHESAQADSTAQFGRSERSQLTTLPVRPAITPPSNRSPPFASGRSADGINHDEATDRKTSETRRQAIEHSDVEEDESCAQTRRAATEHTDTSAPADHLPSVTQPSRRRRRRLSSKNYGIDPNYMLATTNGQDSLSPETEDCPLDSLDLEQNNWTECIEHCLRSNQRQKELTSSSSSWGDAVERESDERRGRDDAALQAKFSAICSRVFSPTVDETVSVISHHPITSNPAKSTTDCVQPLSPRDAVTSVPQIRIEPPDELAPTADSSTHSLSLSRRRNAARSRSLTGDATRPASLSLRDDSSCACVITSPHQHQIVHYPEPTSNPVPVSPHLVVSPFKPRVLRPRRRRARSHDFGTSFPDASAAAADPSASDTQDAEKLQSEQIDERFQELLQTYVFGPDSGGGKVVHRKVRGKWRASGISMRPCWRWRVGALHVRLLLVGVALQFKPLLFVASC